MDELMHSKWLVHVSSTSADSLIYLKDGLSAILFFTPPEPEKKKHLYNIYIYIFIYLFKKILGQG